MTVRVGRSLSFDAVASEYDRTRVIPAPVLEEVARLCAQVARLDQGGLFLDAGVGTGRFAVPLGRLHPQQVVGVDLSAAMMAHAQAKAPRGMLSLVGGDLQRLPFPRGVFQGALLVHVLHLVERWTVVIDEVRRVLRPRTGVLLLGSEQGGRSLVVDHYYDSARAQGLLSPSLGAPGREQTLHYLQRQTGAHIEMIPTPGLAWERVVPIAETLDNLARRTYSQMWDVPLDAHNALFAEAEAYAHRAFPGRDAAETLRARFVLHAVRW